MKPTRLYVYIFTVVASALWCGRAGAQLPLEPAQLPSRTAAYLVWRGTPAGDARKANSLLAMWDDPGFAPVRAAMFENMTNGSQKDASKSALTHDEAEQYSTLLDNAFVLGYITKPETKMTVSAVPPPKAATEHAWNGLFFVYDRAGKEELLGKAVLRLRSQEKEIPKISEITVAGVPALKVERSTGVTYWVEHGKYAASASERTVLEDVLARLEGKSATGSLGESEAYKEAQPQLGGGLIEFFARIPNLKSLASNTSTNGVQLFPVLNAMRLEAIHSLCGRVVLDGSKTRMQGAILGDTAPGTLFDLWGNGQQNPPSLALVPPSAISYSETQFNLLGFYQFLMRVVQTVLPQVQNGPGMIESLAQSRLGMPLPSALGLLTGDFASMQLSPSLDPQKAVYVAGIRKKPELIKLIHTLFSDQVGSERNEGDTTFLKISLSGGQGGAGVAQWNFYHLAVTPDYLLAAGHSETLRDLLAGHAVAAADPPPGALAQFQAARARYPEKLTSENYFDFQKVDWPAVKDRWITEAKKVNAHPTAGAPPKSVPPQVPDLLNNVNLQVFPRHLHFMVGASWKDAKGIHFDQWLE